MSTSEPSSARRLLDRWREWRCARNQRWLEKQAAKRAGDAQADLYKHTWTGGGG
jgi:hypothetical protein